MRDKVVQAIVLYDETINSRCVAEGYAAWFHKCNDTARGAAVAMPRDLGGRAGIVDLQHDLIFRRMRTTMCVCRHRRQNKQGHGKSVFG